MDYLYPDYYRDFHCIASACEDTCCAGWQIAIDEKARRNAADHELCFDSSHRNGRNHPVFCLISAKAIKCCFGCSLFPICATLPICCCWERLPEASVIF